MAEDDPKDDSELQVAATAGSVPEAQLICQRLADAGITAIPQRSIGGPEWGLSGSQYVYVQARDLDRARDVLEAERGEEG